jgi:thioesterase domain-containing protein/acyl carrier protein
VPGRTRASARAPSRQALEERLCHIWAETLELESVAPDDDFFELGGDSLAATAMFDAIAEDLGFEVAAPTLLGASTVRTLVDALLKERNELSPLVTIRASGSRRALFVVHNIVDDLFYARRLADLLDEDQPVYVLRPPAGTDLTSVESLISSYVPAVRRVDPDGPHQFYGFSFGGVIAFELAVELQRRGQEVGLLALGDTAAPRTFDSADGLSAAEVAPWLLPKPPDPIQRRALAAALRATRRPPRDTARELASGIRWLSGRRGRAFVRNRFSRAERARRERDYHNSAAAAAAVELMTTLARNYAPTDPFVGRLVLLRTDDDAKVPHLDWGAFYDPRLLDRQRGWGPYVTGEIDIVRVPGHHYELSNTFLPPIAAVLRERMVDRCT